LHPAKRAEWINILSRVETRGGPETLCYVGVLHPLWAVGESGEMLPTVPYIIRGKRDTMKPLPNYSDHMPNYMFASVNLCLGGTLTWISSNLWSGPRQGAKQCWLACIWKPTIGAQERQTVSERLIAKHDQQQCRSIKETMHAVSSYCFGGNCEFAHLSVRTKSRKLLIRNWRNLVGICPMVNTGSGSKLATFDLLPWELFFVPFQFRLSILNCLT